MYDIVVIGNPTFLLTSDIQQLSGPSVYSAAAASRLGFEQLAIIGSLSPAMTNAFVQSLDTLGVPEYYLIEDDEDTVKKIQYANEEGQSFEFLGVSRRIGIRDIPDEFLQARSILLCPSLQEINEELVEWICNSSDSQVFLKPQLRTVNADSRLELIKDLNLLEKTHCFLDVIQPNEEESLLITGESDLYLAAELLVEWTAEVCIITLGERGSLIYNGDEFHIIPPFETNPIDEIGAGSVYLSGFVSQHLAGNSLSECGAFGSSLASVKVENNGLDFTIDQKIVKQRFEQILESIEVR
ncbi:MAG: carbohydrate kinase family protein [Candidatus Thorarchaeota archaeon]